MLHGIRVTLIAYTASFRVPSFVGYQLTLSVPPLSTIYGLLSAARGQWVLPEHVAWLAFLCDYQSKGMDLEAIYQFERKNERATPTLKPHPKSRTVFHREFLTMPCLTLYLPPEWEASFRCPRYPLLLGRSQDLASVESIACVVLEPIEEGMVHGTLLPWELIEQNNVPSVLYNLPIAFTEEPERRLLGMRLFGVVDAKRRSARVQAPDWLVRDTTSGMVVPLYRQEWITSVLQRAVGEIS